MDLLSDLVAWMAVRATRRPSLAEGVPSPAATCLYHLNIVQDRRQVRSVASGPTGSYWFRRKFVSRIGIYFSDKKKNQSVCVLTDGFPVRSSADSGRYLGRVYLGSTILSRLLQLLLSTCTRVAGIFLNERPPDGGKLLLSVKSIGWTRSIETFDEAAAITSRLKCQLAGRVVLHSLLQPIA